MEKAFQPRSPLQQRFLQLRVWARERPEDSCATLGELAWFLHPLDDLCAVAEGKAGGFHTPLVAAVTAHATPSIDALLTDTQRAIRLQTDDPAARTLMAFWTTLDAPLNFPSPVPR